MRICALLAAFALPLVPWAALPTASSGQSSTANKLSDLQQCIDRARAPASDGTPIRAADTGTAALLQGVGGQVANGNYTCIQHTATMSSCYAHQSRLRTSLGAGDKQGQVIGGVPNTGNSFGAHLHFEGRINGTPVDPMGYL